jgi:TRAP-type C4-dicarboxylate transport system substrate-binding protein
MRAAALAILVGWAGAARAEPTWVLKLSTVAPEGSSWAREFQSFSRDVDAGTHGQVRIKWYFGGVTGDELETGERIARQQLDGIASAGMFAERLSPSMRVLRVIGLFQTAEESSYVLSRIRPTLEEELQQKGFTMLAGAGIGPIVIFSRRPIRTLAEFRREVLWNWDLDEVWKLQFPELGVHAKPMSLYDAAGAFDRGEVDGFITPPTAALAFQWSTKARYYTDLRIGFLSGWILISNRSFDPLPPDVQQVIRAAGARLSVRFEQASRLADEGLLGGLFAKQGMKQVPVSEAFRAEFFAAARVARERAGERLVPAALLNRVIAILADFRAEHQKSAEKR